MPPFHVAYIKGWRRCLTLLVCCQAIRELNCIDEIPQEVKDSFTQIIRTGEIIVFVKIPLSFWHSVFATRTVSAQSMPQFCRTKP